MSVIISFIIRLVGYALLVGVPARIAQYFWERAALDAAEPLRPAHDLAATVVTIAPFVLALIGGGAFRRVAVFIAMYLAGAMLTAPFAFVRFGAIAG